MNAYWMEAKCEFLKLARMRTYSVSTIMFPLMFYCFFGLAMGRQPLPGVGMPLARYALATYGAFAVIGATLYAFGVGVAVERGLGWLEVKRASPMPPGAYFLAKTVVSLAFGAIVVALLFTMGATFGGVRMPASQWLLMGGALVSGGLPFCALGLAIGSFAGPNSAPATVNLIYLPMAFCAGLWLPFEFLPQAIHQAAPFLPAYHFSQIALAVLGAPVHGAVLGHVGSLVAFTAIFAGIAWIGQAREREKVYG
ncbi:MAG: ABC transporter permease [Acidobacteriia bacterium]|nr:ABC transporter permease [Terriglobia bacterium]